MFDLCKVHTKLYVAFDNVILNIELSCFTSKSYCCGRNIKLYFDRLLVRIGQIIFSRSSIENE